MTVGVYAIVDEEMGQVIYVGCSKDIASRWTSHRSQLRNGMCRQRKLVDLYTRFGMKGFSFEVLEETSLDDRREIEKKWIALYLPTDNILYTERNIALNKLKSEMLKGRVTNSPESIERTHQKLRGKKHSQQARDNMSKAHKGKPWSEKRRAAQTAEVRRRIGDASRKRLSTEEEKEKMRQRSFEIWAERRKSL